MLLHDGFPVAKTRSARKKGESRSLGERTREDETTGHQRTVAEDLRTVLGKNEPAFSTLRGMTVAIPRPLPRVYQSKRSEEDGERFSHHQGQRYRRPF